MTKEEALAEAKRRYPNGTVIISPQSGGEFTLRDHHFYYYTHGNSIRARIDGYEPYVYYKGKWAEVISRPEPEVINNYEIY